VALSAPFGIASLLKSVFHPTTLSSDYPEHIITLSSNDSELERDYIAHCIAYFHLTKLPATSFRRGPFMLDSHLLYLRIHQYCLYQE
jgi:hypothetical protein